MLTPHIKDLSTQGREYYAPIIRMTSKNGLYIWQDELPITFATKAEALKMAIAEIEHIEKSRSEFAPRLEQIRESLNAENVSYGELAELQNMIAYIDPSDSQLLETAGV